MPKLTMDGTRLRTLRTALGMTLMECSNLLGVSISTSQRWEKRVDLDEKKIAHIAGAFGVPPEFLTGGTDPVRIPEDCAAVRYMKARHRKFDYAAILPLDPEESPFAEAAEVAADGREAFSYAFAEDGICSAESDAQTSAETACPVSCTPPLFISAAAAQAETLLLALRLPFRSRGDRRLGGAVLHFDLSAYLGHSLRGDRPRQYDRDDHHKVRLGSVFVLFRSPHGDRDRGDHVRLFPCGFPMEKKHESKKCKLK